MDESKGLSPWKLAFGAVGVVVGLNLILRGLLNLESGSTIAFLAAGGASLLPVLWIAKVVRRPPTEGERKRLLLLYCAFLAVLCAVVVLLAIAGIWLYPGGIVFLVIHSVVYLFFAVMFWSKKQFVRMFPNEPNRLLKNSPNVSHDGWS
jgi:peptidoglycan biosynthesis protein MviN/MurJ (putative lipid II flippase)